MHSPFDKTVGIDNAADIFQVAKHPKSFISLDTADHLLSTEADAIYVGEVIAGWVSRYLEPSLTKSLDSETSSPRHSICANRQKVITLRFILVTISLSLMNQLRLAALTQDLAPLNT